jgi:hypothetical protein
MEDIVIRREHWGVVITFLNHFFCVACSLFLGKHVLMMIKYKMRCRDRRCTLLSHWDVDQHKFVLNWVHDHVKVTGIIVGKNIADTQNMILKEKTTKIQALPNMWNSRKLTIKGKFTSLRSKVLLAICRLYRTRSRWYHITSWRYVL